MTQQFFRFAQRLTATLVCLLAPVALALDAPDERVFKTELYTVRASSVPYASALPALYVQ